MKFEGNGILPLAGFEGLLDYLCTDIYLVLYDDRNCNTTEIYAENRELGSVIARHQ